VLLAREHGLPAPLIVAAAIEAGATRSTPKICNTAAQSRRCHRQPVSKARSAANPDRQISRRRSIAFERKALNKGSDFERCRCGSHLSSLATL
jgi:hypothetical protein